MKRALSKVWPFVATALVFAVIFFRIPFRRLVDALEAASLGPFLALMIVFSLAYFAIDTLVLVKMIRWFHGPIRYRDLLPVRATTYVVSIINTQLAQGALALYLNRRFLTPLADVGGTVATLILLEVTQLVAFATAGMAVFARDVPRGLFYAPAALALLWIVLIVAVRRPSASRLADAALLRTFRRATAGQLLTILALKGSTFVIALAVHRAALPLFGIHIPTLRLFAFLPIVFMVAALPLTVAHLGTSQAAWIYFFSDHAPAENLLAYSLAAHLTFMLANGALGLAFLPKAYADLFVYRRREDISRPSNTAAV